MASDIDKWVMVEAFETAGYWILPNGKLKSLQGYSDHDSYIDDHYRLFGFTKEEANVGKADIAAAIDKGAVRINIFRGKMGIDGKPRYIKASADAIMDITLKHEVQNVWHQSLTSPLSLQDFMIEFL